jgi:hypothetical protein
VNGVGEAATWARGQKAGMARAGALIGVVEGMEGFKVAAAK